MSPKSNNQGAYNASQMPAEKQPSALVPEFRVTDIVYEGLVMRINIIERAADACPRPDQASDQQTIAPTDNPYDVAA